MNEFAIAYVNAHMAEGASHGVEENQVARVQITAFNFFSGFGLLIRTPGQQTTHRSFVDVTHKTAAIKTRFG
jgi:hypothetical protein